MEWYRYGRQAWRIGKGTVTLEESWAFSSELRAGFIGRIGGAYYTYEWHNGRNERGPYPTLEAAKLAAELLYG